MRSHQDALVEPPAAKRQKTSHVTNYGAITATGSAQHNGHVYGDIHHHYACVDDKLRHYRNELFLTYPESDRADLISAKGKRADGTCEWIRSDKTYTAWRTGDTHLLWISGGAGKGKTMLSIFLTQELEKEEQQTIYYFCANNDQKRSTAAAVLRGLLWQLTGKCSQLAEHLAQHFDSPEKTQATLDSRELLWAIFSKVVQDPRVESTFCILDGLDELDEDSQIWLIAQLVDATTTATFSSMKLVLVSRPIFGLDDCAQVKLDPDNDRSVGEDIKRFIAVRVEDLAKRHLLSSKLRQHVENTLLERAEGTFLWVGFAMVELLKKKTVTELQVSLRTLPKGLYGIYSRMVLQMDPDFRPIGLKILRWVTMASRPLKLLELAAATGAQPSEHMDTKHIIRDHVAMCGPLVTVQSRQVRLVHQSAKDYLLRHEVDQDATLEAFRIRREEAHDALATDCLRYIERSRLEHELMLIRERSPGLFQCDSDESDSDHSEPDQGESEFNTDGDNPLLSYAVEFWPEHAREAFPLADYLTQSKSFFRVARLQQSWWKLYRDSDQRTFSLDLESLHIACHLGIHAWVKLLLATGNVDVNSLDLDHRTPLSWAAGNNHEAVVALLLATRKANVFLKDDDGQTPLCWAAKLGHEKIVELLLATGKVDVNSKDDHGLTPLDWAEINCHASVAELLRRHGASALRARSDRVAARLDWVPGRQRPCRSGRASESGMWPHFDRWCRDGLGRFW